MGNIVYIACSIDGYIADRDGSITFLQSVPMSDEVMGLFTTFMGSVDAIVMGRNTYNTVLDFGGEWPYSKKVFVLSHSLSEIRDDLVGKVEIVNSDNVATMVDSLNDRGFHRLYIDGGSVIQSFLKENLIDELIISTIPVVLGGGIPLFKELSSPITFKLISSKIIDKVMVQSHFKRV